MSSEIRLIPVRGIPIIQPGDDLAAIILEHLDEPIQEHDIVVLAQKIVSRAENQLVHLSDVEPSAKALELAPIALKDPRLVEIILRDTKEILRLHQGVLIVEQRCGFISANAGVDRSNVPPGDGEVVALLPEDSDASATRLADRIRELSGQTVAVIINDSHGRPWREGSVGIAIGVSGLPALRDVRGHHDLFGYELQTSVIGRGDEIASAASLLMGQSNEAIPVVIVRGLEYEAGPGSAQDLLRPKEKDLFR